MERRAFLAQPDHLVRLHEMICQLLKTWRAPPSPSVYSVYSVVKTLRLPRRGSAVAKGYGGQAALPNIFQPLETVPSPLVKISVH